MFCKNCGKELIENALFCPSCGTKIEMVSEKNLSSTTETEIVVPVEKAIIVKAETLPEKNNEELAVVIECGSEKGINGKDDVYCELIGKNADYYLSAFEKIRCGEKTKFMWSSLFASLGLPLYRNCDEVAKKYYLTPYVLLLSSLVLMPCATLFGFSTLSMVMLAGSYVISAIGDVWIFVNAIRLGKNFPSLYMTHLDNLIASYNIKKVSDCAKVPGQYTKTNLKKVIFTCIALCIIMGLLSAVGAAITGIGITRSYDADVYQQSATSKQDESLTIDNAETADAYDWIEFGESIACDVGYVVMPSGKLNVRNAPNREADIVGRLESGTTVYVIDEHDGWSKLSTDIGIEGYASSDYIEYEHYWTDWDSVLAHDVGYVNIQEGVLNVRSSASTDARVVGTLQKGAKIAIIDSYDGWAQISVYDDSDIRGFVVSDYIIREDDMTHQDSVNINAVQSEPTEESKPLSTKVKNSYVGEYLHQTSWNSNDAINKTWRFETDGINVFMINGNYIGEFWYSDVSAKNNEIGIVFCVSWYEGEPAWPAGAEFVEWLSENGIISSGGTSSWVYYDAVLTIEAEKMKLKFSEDLILELTNSYPDGRKYKGFEA